MIEHILTGAAPTPSPAALYRLGTHVILLLLIDRTARVLNLEGDFHALSETAAALLRALLQTDIDAEAQRLACRYQVALPRIRHDLETCARTYLQIGVIRPTTQPSPDASTPTSRVLIQMLGMAQRPTGRRLERQVWWLLPLFYLATRRWGWPATLRGCQQVVSRLDRREAVTGSPPVTPDGIEAAVIAVAARHPVPVACKERALAAWWLLRANGVPAQLVLGVELFPLASHAWCELAGRVIADLPERCARFTPVVRYD